jgi:hypothetical protein
MVFVCQRHFADVPAHQTNILNWHNAGQTPECLVGGEGLEPPTLSV